MNLDPNWIPMKWPCGPLDLARRGSGTSQGVRETLAAWAKPAALDLLKGTPINCLVVEWAAGGPDDSAQQQALRPLIEAGQRIGIGIVAQIASGPGLAISVDSAHAAGISAAIVTTPPAESLALPVILQFARDQVAWEKTTPTFSSTGHDWPGLKLDNVHGDTAVAGPTGVPWVNSNAWFSLLGRELAPGKIRWLDFDPPDDPTYPPTYAMAAADSLAYGSRWIISLNDDFRAALLKANPLATAAWRETCETLSFFEDHRGWEDFQSQGALAVISDFRGEHAFLSGEVLNLLNRRHVQFQVIEKSKDLSKSLAGLKAILWLDSASPRKDQLSELLAFVRTGGLLIAPDYWGPAGTSEQIRDPAIDYKMYNVARGQIAVPVEGFENPYQVAMDAHLLASRRNDIVRLFNPATASCHASYDPGRKTQLVQVVNYAAQPADFVTLWVRNNTRAGLLWKPGAKNAASISGSPAAPGTEFDLPAIAVTCAVEIEGTNS